MITLQTNPRAVRVGHWHIERPEWRGTECIKKQIKEVRFDNPDTDYEGLLHGFGVEGEASEMYCFALVQKSDNTFDTPSVTVIQLID